MIELSGLSHAYGNKRVLESIDLKLANGKCYGIYAPDGSGKSTLFALLSGGMLPQKGAVRINGFDTRRDAVSARRCVGYMPQTVGFYSEMTVFELLDFVAGIRNVRADRRFRHVHRTLEVTELDTCRNRMLKTLSPALLRRVAFAQTLIGDPGILILDEPADGLSMTERTSLYELIATVVTEQKKTLFLASSSETLSALCDEVLLLHDGRLTAKEQPDGNTESAGASEEIPEQEGGPEA